MKRKILSLFLISVFTALTLLPTMAFAANANIAYASTQLVEVDGKPVKFQAYALKDEHGNDTNYVKLRDVAHVLNGTPAQFQVGWDGAVNITPGQAYTDNGSEMSTPFTGNRAYISAAAPTNINGSAVPLSTIVLTDDNGNGYTYYKLRDLGTALGFLVDWSAKRGIYIETGSEKPVKSINTRTISCGAAYYPALIDQNGTLWTKDGPNDGGYIKMMEHMVSVECGRWGMVALDAQGVLWQWDYCLGSGDFYHATQMMDHVISYAGASSIIALKADGTIWTWDYTSGGLIERTSKEITGLDNVTCVSSGFNHFAAIKSDGSLWMWGSNGVGQIGNNGKSTSTNEYGEPIQDFPVKVMDNVKSVCCGDYSTAAIKTDGSLWVWGRNTYGELGNGGLGNAATKNGTLYQNAPTKIMDDVVCVSINGDCFPGAWGGTHVTAVKKDGSLWCWGMNAAGQVGNGGSGNMVYGDDKARCQNTPVKIMDNVYSAVSAFDCTFAIQTDGTIWQWGYISEPGNAIDPEYEFSYQSVPVQISDFKAKLP